MKQYVKTDKFGCWCGYLTEGKVYKVLGVFGDYGATIERDDGCGELNIHLCNSAHTGSQWYFCDANGDKIEDEVIVETPTKTITICVEKTVRYNQEVKVTVDEYERLSNLNQDDLSKELTKLFDEDVAEVDDVDIKVDSYDFED